MKHTAIIFALLFLFRGWGFWQSWRPPVQHKWNPAYMETLVPEIDEDGNEVETTATVVTGDVYDMSDPDGDIWLPEIDPWEGEEA